MSQPYAYEGNFDPDPRPRKRGGSGCLKGCLIAGGILAVLGVLVVIGVVWMVNRVAKGITDDPQELAQRLKQRFPTAVLPQGYEGKMGIKFNLFGVEMDLMVFGKGQAQVGEEGQVISGDALLIASINVPGAKQDDLEEAVQGINRKGKVVEKKRYTIQAGGYEFEGFWQTVEHREGGVVVKQPQVLIPLGGGTMAIMQGTDDQVDEEALKEFLASIAKDVPTAKHMGEKGPEKQAPAKKAPTKTEQPPKKDDGGEG